jgi:hypothetical protein
VTVRRGLWLVALAGAACAPRLPRMRAPVPCCASADDLARLDGKRVLLDGIYRARFVTMRPGDDERRRAAGERPTTAGIATEAGPVVMLGIYHDRAAARPAEEIERLDGRHVVVMGRLHAHTPPAPGPAATMTGPYIDAIERIDVQ